MTSWIFQANPDDFRVDDYLRENKEVYWNVNQKMEEISCGDVVYIWRSNGTEGNPGGIVAKGKIVEYPYEMPDYVKSYMRNKPRSYFRGARIIIEDVRLDEAKGMLKRNDLKNDNVVKDLNIILMPMQATYILTQKHVKHIDHLWEQKKIKSQLP